MNISLILKGKCINKTIRMCAMAAACSLLLSLSACSDDRGNDVPVGTGGGAPPPPVDNVQTQTTPDVPPPAKPSTPSPETGGACVSLVNTKCIDCHSVARICEKLGKKSSSRWKRTINRMIERGAKVNSDEAATLLDCLARGVKEFQTTCQ